MLPPQDPLVGFSNKNQIDHQGVSGWEDSSAGKPQLYVGHSLHEEVETTTPLSKCGNLIIILIACHQCMTRFFYRSHSSLFRPSVQVTAGTIALLYHEHTLQTEASFCLGHCLQCVTN